MVASLRTQPCGSTRPPPPPSGRGLRALFSSPCCNCARGDCASMRTIAFCVEPPDTTDSSRNCIRAAGDLLGLELDPSEEQSPSDDVLILGESLQIGTSHIVDSSPEKRRRRRVACLRGILARNRSPPDAAAMSRGGNGIFAVLDCWGARPCSLA